MKKLLVTFLIAPLFAFSQTKINVAYTKGSVPVSPAANDTLFVKRANGTDIQKVLVSSISPTDKWNITGNAGTTAGTNFLGTTDAQDVVFKRNSIEGGRFTSTGFALGLSSSLTGSLIFRNATNANTLTVNSGVTSASYAVTLPTAQGAANSFLMNNGSGTLTWNTGTGLFWALDGNTVGAEKWIGTIDNFNMPFRTNNTQKMVIESGGDVGIGISDPAAKLHVVQTTTVNPLFEVDSGSVVRFKILPRGQFKMGDNYNNLFIGNNSGNAFVLGASEEGQWNIGIGNLTLQSSTSGNNNVAISAASMQSNTTGRHNVAIGSASLSSNTTGMRNIAIGTQNSVSNNGDENTSIGYQAMLNSLTAYSNVALGRLAGYTNSSGDENTWLGTDACFSCNTGSRNIHIGYRAGFYQTTESDIFSVNNQDRGDKATEIIESILYGIQNANPASQSLNINVGTLQLSYTGTPGAGKVLTSDADGTATWETAATCTSSTYTPTITDSANTIARTAYQCQWSRAGNVVTVSGVADVDPSAPATSTIIKITLPVTSNFTLTGNLGGTAFAPGIAAQGAGMLPTTAYAVADFALMQWISGDVTNQPMRFSFTYLVQ